MANKHINKKKLDPLMLTAIKMGVELSKTNGLSARENAREYYKCSILAQQLIARTLKDNKQDWNALTMEEKSEISSECMQILMDRSKTQQAMNKLGIV